MHRLGKPLPKTNLLLRLQRRLLGRQVSIHGRRLHLDLLLRVWVGEAQGACASAASKGRVVKACQVSIHRRRLTFTPCSGFEFRHSESTCSSAMNRWTAAIQGRAGQRRHARAAPGERLQAGAHGSKRLGTVQQLGSVRRQPTCLMRLYSSASSGASRSLPLWPCLASASSAFCGREREGGGFSE